MARYTVPCALLFAHFVLSSLLLRPCTAHLYAPPPLTRAVSIPFTDRIPLRPPSNASVACVSLQLGQYRCDEPVIDGYTQSALGCTPAGTVAVPCYPVRNVTCDGAIQNGTAPAFSALLPCRYTNGYEYSTALLLSIFFGFLGIDRFYLGYPAVGLLKLCTLGFFMFGYVIDVVLILLQVVGPADGSAYIIPFYGPRLVHVQANEDTAYKPSNYR